MTRASSILARPLLLLAGTVLAALLAEGLTRLLAPRLMDLDNASMRFDPQLGWLQRAGVTATRINEAHQQVSIEGHALGFRNPPQDYRLSNAENVLVVGDSMTAGNQVRFKDTWPAQLERLLASRRPRLQVINAAVDGYDLAQSYRWAERLWPRFQPRHLIVALYVGNDIIDYERVAQARPPWRESAPLTWLREHSYFHHLLSGGLRRFRERTRGRRFAREGPALPNWTPNELPGLSGLTPQELGRIRGQFAAPDLLPALRGGEESERRMRSTERMLLAFAELAASRKAGFALVLLPIKQQAIPAQKLEWMRLHGLSEEQADDPQTRLAAWAAVHGIAIVDATPALSEAPAPEQLFWRIDLHLSPAGHAAVAASVSPVLDEALNKSAAGS